MKIKQATKQPSLTQLLIYPTDCCNLKCQHCYYNAIYETSQNHRTDEVSYDHLCGAIEELLPFGLRGCKLSGGEPFLRKDLIDICRYIDSRGISVAIETNGTFINERDAKVLGQLHGRTTVSISIDGANPDTHETCRGISGCFNDTMRGLKYLVNAGVEVQVIVCLFEANKTELPRLMKICAEKGVRTFKMNFINPIGRAKQLSLVGLSEAYKIDAQLVEYASVIGINYCSSIPIALQSVKQMMKTCALNNNCNICSTLGILADGTITICGMGKYVNEFKFGTLGQDSIAEVWMTHPTLKLVRTEIPNRLRGICGCCIFRSNCLGRCRLNNENVTLDSLFDPYWECAEMEKHGLFPKSRIVDCLEVGSKDRSLSKK